MKPKLLSVLLVLSLGINCGVVFTVGYHWWKAKQFCAEPCWNKSQCSRRLNLNSDQIKIMENKRQEMQKRMSPLKEEIRRKRLELWTLVKSDKIEELKVNKLLADISRLQSDIEKKVIQHSIEVKKILTPQQKEQFNCIFEQGLCPGEMHPLPGDRCEKTAMR